MSWIGLDIGGANLKAASSVEQSAPSIGLPKPRLPKPLLPKPLLPPTLIPFPLWQNPNGLSDTLCQILQSVHGNSSSTTNAQPRVAATMTGELADCFSSRREGVAFIVDAVSNACQRCNLEPPVFVGTDLEWRNAADAKADWLKTAASNWAAMATFSSRFLPRQTGFIVDMGSTTTDIIPVRDGVCVAAGKTDRQRLQSHELIYMGAGRTPICSICSHFELSSDTIPVAREFFATTEDAMVVARLKPENANNKNTADGKPLTIEHSSIRLARMICEDADQLSVETIRLLADQTIDSMSSILLHALTNVIGSDMTQTKLLISGTGEAFLERQLKNAVDGSNLIRLSEQLSKSLSSVAPAYAVAVLADETLGHENCVGKDAEL
jgi:probable H4MPT-linked C1 transfer pathway protein